ncbi:thiosulfate dehydrogenase [Pedobacter sp. UYP24]
MVVIIILLVFLAGLTVILVKIYVLPGGLPVLEHVERLRAPEQSSTDQSIKKAMFYKVPDIKNVKDSAERKLILYGKDLVVNTSKYLGPKGSVMRISNGMNCQNCHLDAGTKPMGNNYFSVFSTYPKFRSRSGTKETILKRISDCFERSLNASKIDTNGKEVSAMAAYLKFLGTDIKKGTKPKGVGLEKLPYLDRAADPVKGLLVYQSKCSSCHGVKGDGLFAKNKTSYVYPPLWGKSSYNNGAGLYRISNFAGYVKNNMPFGVSYENPLLSDEEAWDVAAYVNSQPRPQKNQQNDWVDISNKPFDFPFGPYNDEFSENQHKYGPFKAIVQTLKQSKKI